MPFCSSCGSEVRQNDQFCGRCGAPQTGAPQTGSAPPKAAAATAGDPFPNVNDNTTAVLCYIPFIGWIASIYVLSVDRFRRNNTVRFHAFQGLYLFVAWLIYDWVIESILFSVMFKAWVVTRFVKLLLVGTWLYLMFKTSQREVVRLPIIGDLADQSIAEQK